MTPKTTTNGRLTLKALESAAKELARWCAAYCEREPPKRLILRLALIPWFMLLSLVSVGAVVVQVCCEFLSPPPPITSGELLVKLGAIEAYFRDRELGPLPQDADVCMTLTQVRNQLCSSTPDKKQLSTCARELEQISARHMSHIHYCAIREFGGLLLKFTIDLDGKSLTI